MAYPTKAELDAMFEVTPEGELKNRKTGVIHKGSRVYIGERKRKLARLKLIHFMQTGEHLYFKRGGRGFGRHYATKRILTRGDPLTRQLHAMARSSDLSLKEICRRAGVFDGALDVDHLSKHAMRLGGAVALGQVLGYQLVWVPIQTALPIAAE